MDKEKAALYGISTEQMVEALSVALVGSSRWLAHLPAGKEDVPIFVRFPREHPSGVDALQGLKLKGSGGGLVPLSELGRVETTVQPPFVAAQHLGCQRAD